MKPRWWPLNTPSFDPFVLPAGPGQFKLPFGPPPISRLAMFAPRHMALYGTTREQMAKVAITFRQPAANDLDARFRTLLSTDTQVEALFASASKPLHAP